MSQLQHAPEVASSLTKSTFTSKVERMCEQWRKDGELWSMTDTALNDMMMRLDYYADKSTQLAHVCPAIFEMLRFLHQHGPRHGFFLFLAATVDNKTDDSALKRFTKHALYDRNLLGVIGGLLFRKTTDEYFKAYAEPTDRLVERCFVRNRKRESPAFATAIHRVLQLCTARGEVDLRIALQRSLLNHAERTFQEEVLGALSFDDGWAVDQSPRYQRALSYVIWVGQLFKLSLIDDRIPVWCANSLCHPLQRRQHQIVSEDDMKTYDERERDCLKTLVRLVHDMRPRLASVNPQALETLIANIAIVAENIPATGFSEMTMSLLRGLLEPASATASEDANSMPTPKPVGTV